MKISDLDKNINLSAVTFKHPETGEPCFFVSQWNKGVWYRKPNQEKPNQIFPLFVESLDEVLDFEVLSIYGKRVENA